MTRTKMQMRIEDFLKELSILSQKYGMIVDANGNQSEGTPLALYARLSKTPKYSKVGCLFYSFEGEEEKSVYNFDPKENSKYQEVRLSLKDLVNGIDIPEGTVDEFLSQFPKDMTTNSSIPDVPDAPK